MSRTLQLTNGTTTVSLISTSGSQLRLGGYRAGTPNKRTLYNESMFAAGRVPVMTKRDNVRTPMSLAMVGTNQNNLAAQLQTLVKLLRQAENYHLYDWETTPVYLQEQLTNETGARYALVYGSDIDLQISLFDPPVDPGDYIEDFKVTIEREPFWRSHAPKTLPTGLTLEAPEAPDPQEDATEQYVINARDPVGTLLYLYNYDASATAFSANLAASATFNYFEVSGSTPAVGDMVYFGSANPFWRVVLNVGTAFVGSGVTLTGEYWDGAAWSAGPDVEKFLVEFGVQLDGTITVHWMGATDWTIASVNGQNAYWMRIRITAITTWTTSPDQAEQVPHTVRSNYFTIPASAIDGDLPAVPLFKFSNHFATSVGSYITHVIMGAKSRGLTNFMSRINCGSGQNGVDWSELHSTDTSVTGDVRHTSGEVSLCTFATTATISERFRAYFTDSDIAADFAGSYHCFIRAEQNGGSAGDVAVRLSYEIGGEVEVNSDVVYLQQVDAGPEVIDVGRFTLQPMEAESGLGESADPSWSFVVDALSDNGATPNLKIFDIVLIPVDEWGLVVCEPVYVNAKMGAYDQLTIDSGLFRYGTILQSDTGVSIENTFPWETRGILPMIEPSREYQVHFLFHNDGIATNELGGAFFVYVHECWEFLRGAD